MKRNILNARIISICYKNTNEKMTCIIRWYNHINDRLQVAKGVSRCNPNDTFSLKKGKRIAESRAKMEIYNCMVKHISEMYRISMSKYEMLLLREGQHLNDVIHECL